MEPQIHAWVQVHSEPALSAGPLSAIPFGAKDIIETKGLSTEYGSPIYKGRIGTTDAAIVRQIRQRGGILVGKTQTVAFAFRDPAPTRNPRDVTHTPGGSSSGSAAAVAAGTVPVTIGTQTGGSVLRPASFCGVTGFKASYGLLPMDGILPLAKSLDTLGFFTHTPSDMLAFWEAMGQSTGRDEDFPIAAPEPLPAVDPEMRIAFDDALVRLSRAGFKIHRIDIGAMLEKLTAANRTLMYYEGARVHRDRFAKYGDRLGAVAELVREGSRLSDNEYRDALTYIRDCKAKVQELYKVTPVIVVPAAPGPAPLGLSSTGDSRMNAPWTTLGTPAISIPMPVGSALPLGLQLTANHGEDARVIRTAIRVEQTFRGLDSKD